MNEKGRESQSTLLSHEYCGCVCWVNSLATLVYGLFFGRPLPVWNSRTSIARLVDLGIQSFQGGTVVLRAQGKVGALRTLREMVVVAVRIYAAAIHRWVQWSNASIGVLLIWAEGTADNVLDFGIFPLLCLLLPKLPLLGLYSGETC